MVTTPSTDEIGKILAKALLTQLEHIGKSETSCVGLVIETKDVDAVGPALVRSLEEHGKAVEVGCVWTHKRKTSLDRTLVEISRTHLENINYCTVVAIVHLEQMCADTLKAIKSRIGERLNDDVELIILTSDPVTRHVDSFPTARIAFCDLRNVDGRDQGIGKSLETAWSDWASDPFGPDHYPQFIQDRIRSKIAKSKTHAPH